MRRQLSLAADMSVDQACAAVGHNLPPALQKDQKTFAPSPVPDIRITGSSWIYNDGDLLTDVAVMDPTVIVVLHSFVL
jgi:hypothetical protein